MCRQTDYPQWAITRHRVSIAGSLFPVSLRSLKLSSRILANCTQKLQKNVGDMLTQKSEEQPEEYVVSRAPPPDGYGLGPQAKGNKGKESQPNAGNPFQTLGPMLEALSNGGKASGLGGKGKDAGSFQPTAEQQIPQAQAGAGQKPQGPPTNLGNPFPNTRVNAGWFRKRRDSARQSVATR